ncbi:MAG: GumC family protein, partial [Chloroflexota bacterium]
MENYNQEINEEVVDLKQIFFKFFRFWYLFVIAVALSLTVAYLFNKYTKPIYKVGTTILVKDEKSALDAQTLLGLGNIKNAQSIENEIGILKSRSLITRAIRSLNFDISYFSEENFIARELYDETPFTVIFDTANPQPAGLRFYISIKNNREYTLSSEGEKASSYYYTKERREIPINEAISVSGRYRFGQEVKGKYYNFKIVLNHNFKGDEHLKSKMFFVFNKIEDLTREFSEFTIEPINREASIVEISLQGNNVNKAADFLNALTREYLQRSLEKKNQIATNTILFIDDQLLGITDSLRIAESDLQQFRTTNEVMDLDFQSQQVFQTMGDLEKQKAELIVKNQYYNYLSDYLRDNRNDITGLTVPSSMGIDDPVLTKLITDLTRLYAERGEAHMMAREKNPIIASFDERISVNKRTLAENVKNIINTSNIAIRNIDKRISAMSGKINQLPTTQRMLFGIERKFKLSDAIYTFLLEKRSDAQITRASNMPDNEVLDIADPSEMIPVLPKRTLNYTIALLIGILLPV